MIYSENMHSPEHQCMNGKNEMNERRMVNGGGGGTKKSNVFQAQAPKALATETARKIMNQIKMGKFSICTVVRDFLCHTQRKNNENTLW